MSRMEQVESRKTAMQPSVWQPLRYGLWARDDNQEVPASNSTAESAALFYNAVSSLWLALYGEHVHVGYFPDAKDAAGITFAAAQDDMIDRLLEVAGIRNWGRDVRQLLDVGCGYGATACHLARKLGCTAVGVNISEQQVRYANQLAARCGLPPGAARFVVGDALSLPPLPPPPPLPPCKASDHDCDDAAAAAAAPVAGADASCTARHQSGSDAASAMLQPTPDGSGCYDLVVSVEASTYMTDKCRYVSELTRMAAPGGRVIVSDFFRAPGKLSAQQLAALEGVVTNFSTAGPDAWVCVEEIAELMADAGLRDVRIADWTPHIRGFWWLSLPVLLARTKPGQAPPSSVAGMVLAFLRNLLVSVLLLLVSLPLLARSGLLRAVKMVLATVLPPRLHVAQRALDGGALRYAVVVGTRPKLQ